jgi:hypothetical protein
VWLKRASGALGLRGPHGPIGRQAWATESIVLTSIAIYLKVKVSAMPDTFGANDLVVSSIVL